MGLVRWATVGAWLLFGLCLGCSASSVQPGDPTHQAPPDLERSRLELPEVQVPGPDVPSAEEAAPVAQDPVEESPIEVHNAPRATSDKKRICDCSPADLLCAMSCAKPVSSPSATPSSGVFDRSAASKQMSMAATIARSHCARSGGPVGSTRVTVQFATTGRVTSASIGSPYTSTETGSCVVKVFRQAIIPPFKGSPVSVSKSVSISSGR